MPLPMPLAPAVMTIHGALLTAVHRQAAAAATVTVPRAPALGTTFIVGAIVPLQSAPDWISSNERPAIVSVPARGWRLGLPATAYATALLPMPLLPDEMDAHDTLLFADHAHPSGAETCTVPDWAPPPSALRTGAIE